MDTIFYFHAPSQTSTPDKLAGVKHAADTFDWHVREINELPTKKMIRELIGFWHPLGAIVDCEREFHDISPSTFNDLPTIYLDQNPHSLPKSCSCISHDSSATGRLAAKELLLTGFPHYAYVPSSPQQFWSEERERGFRLALSINHYDCITYNTNTSTESGIIYQRNIRKWLKNLPKPCGVFAANDRIAAEVLTAATYLGIEAPQELAVVGVDNFASICEHTTPPLTSIQPDFLRGGELAVLTLRDMIKQKDKCVFRLTFGPAYVMRRASSRMFRYYDKKVAAAVELIRRKACEGLTAREVSMIFTCSRRMAEMKFRKITGHSILDEIQSVRIEKVKRMLQETDRNLSVMANLCGLKNQNSLCKLFRKETGMTMTDWRRSHIG